MVYFTHLTLCDRGISYGPVSVCVCVSVTIQRSVETVKQFELVFGTETFFKLSYEYIIHCAAVRKFGYLQNNGTSPRNFVPKSRPEILPFCHQYKKKSWRRRRCIFTEYAKIKLY